MKNLIILFFSVLLLTSCKSSNVPYDDSGTLNNEKTETIIKPDDVEVAFEKIISTSRKRGSDGEYSTAQYLDEQLTLMGYKSEIVPFDVYRSDIDYYFNDFFNINPFNEEPIAKSHNVIAEKDFDTNKKTIVFSAHYDTTKNSIGATDNGSGTAVLLETAKLIEPYIENLDYNVRIIFFGSEEYYLSGSKSYVSSLDSDELDNIIGCFNIDMTSTKEWRKMFIDCKESLFSNEFLRLNPNFETMTMGASDEISFFKKGIMSFRFTTVNIFDENFDSKALVDETENKYVETELIKEDANIIFNFMKNLNINNLYIE